jgi:uncharacterized membrane protein YgaE (UPF0421/DUF939 family)
MSWLVPKDGLQLAVRASVGAALALALAQFLGLQYPLYAAIAAVIVTDLSVIDTGMLGIRRFVGTVIGAPCGAVLAMLIPDGPLAIGVSILTAMLLCNLFRAKEGAKIAGFTCGIIVVTHTADPWEFAFFRLVETMLGIAVAWAISYVPKLLRADPPENSAH